MKAEALYIKIDKTVKGGGKEVHLFPSDTDFVCIKSYTNSRKREGGAPSISASFYFSRPLDKEWTREEYVEFDGERYYATSIPSSSKDSASGLYKHEASFVSKREVLDNTLFFDVVSQNPNDTNGGDKYRSNQTKFSFGGDINEFVSRINDSMAYCGLYDRAGIDGYCVVVDEGYGTGEVKELSFESQYLSEVIQLIKTTFELDYYWTGRVCHVGSVQHDLSTSGNYGSRYVLQYGSDAALMSVQRNNTNNKAVDVITGCGSSDNIPYYYPNTDEYGKAVFNVENIDKDKVSVALSKYWGIVGTGDNKKLTLYKGKEGGVYKGEILTSELSYTGGYSSTIGSDNCSITTHYEVRILAKKGMVIDLTSVGVGFAYNDWANEYHKGLVYDSKEVIRDFYLRDNENTNSEDKSISKGQTVGTACTYEFKEDGDYTLHLDFLYSYKSKSWKDSQGVYHQADRSYFDMSALGSVKFSYAPTSEYIWVYDGDKSASYDKCGIEIEGLSSAAAILFEYNFTKDEKGNYTFAQITRSDTTKAVSVMVTGRTWIYPSANLMPSIYRKSGGDERFYYATNSPSDDQKDIYTIPGTDSLYHFSNPYKSGNPHQGYVTFDDIKPTIRGIRNDLIQADGLGQLFGEIADVAFDKTDSDAKDENNNLLHPYFYIKLHKFSGEFGFDLFKHALESETGKIEMIECHGCPACSFPIMCYWDKTNNICYNPVSVDKNGNLKAVREDYQDYIMQESDIKSDMLNQNSQTKEIWIAVQKETSTLGVVMPNASAGFKPKQGDKFVITGIKAPSVLITAAERRLDEALIKHMSENNEDKFSYSVKFSRIFLQENPDFAAMLNENTKLTIKYNNELVDVFVSNYQVKIDDNALVSAEVELVNSLEAGQSDIKQIIQSVEGEVVRGLGNISTGGNSFNASIADKMYLSKVKRDTAQELINFEKGLTFGDGTHRITPEGVAIFKELVSQIFKSGANGSGFKLGNYSDSEDSYLEVDRLLVRKAAEFVKLVIRELQSVGGEIVLSPASMKISKVQFLRAGTLSPDSAPLQYDVYRCSFLTKRGDEEITNPFVVNDLVRCQTFNIKEGTTANAKNKYYWRRVVRVGTDYIDILALSGGNYGDSQPEVGDELVQMGNTTDVARQSVLYLSAYGSDSPSIKLYKGVNECTLDGKEIFVVSRDEIYALASMFKLKVKDGDTTKETTLAEIVANVDGLTSTVAANKKETDGQISKINTTLTQNAESITSLTQKQTETENKVSKIEQTTDKISLQVETTTNLKNCIVGSALRPWDDITRITAALSQKVEITNGGGVGGSNCATFSASGATSNTYTGLYFKDVRVSAGKTYVFSVWAKIVSLLDNGAYYSIKRFDGGTEGAVVKPGNIILSIGDWKLFTTTFTVPDGCTKLLLELAVRRNGAISVCRPMIMEGTEYGGWSLSPYDKTEAGKLESGLKRAGIDLEDDTITATANKFLVKNNDGEVTASVNEDGLLEVGAGLFSGLIRKKKTIITPDKLEGYTEENSINGYIRLNFVKAGSFVELSGDIGKKTGGKYPTIILPFHNPNASNASLGVTSEEAATCLGQTFIVRNNTSPAITINIVGYTSLVGGGNTAHPYWLESGWMAVLTCELVYVSNANTYAIVWNGYNVPFSSPIAHSDEGVEAVADEIAEPTADDPTTTEEEQPKANRHEENS
nr:MAG TPA: tail protein [Caudoviricetes sp.]